MNKIRIKRIFLNAGLQGIILSVMNASIILSGLSARWIYSPAFDILSMLIPSLILTIVCSGAFKGYMTEFIGRYRKAFYATIIIEAVTWAASMMWMYSAVSKNRGSDWMPGLSLLGDYVIMWILWVIIAIVIAVIWIVSVRRYLRQSRNDE